jgi:hypothetical protein
MTGAAPQPLTPWERLAIAVGIAVLVLTARVGVTLATSLAFGSQPKEELIGTVGILGLVLLLPIGIALVEKILAAERKRRWWIEAALLAGYGCASAALALLTLFSAIPTDDWQIVLEASVALFPTLAAAAVMLLSIAIGVVSAIQRYRLALEADTKRWELEAAAARKAREVIEERMRPALVISTLENVASQLDRDDPHAEAALLRLARRERLLLQASFSAGGSAGPVPEPIPDGTPRWTTSYAAALTLYFAASILTDLRYITWQGPWNLATMTLLSAALWFGAAPLLHWATGKVVRFRFPAAISLAAACAAGATALVTATSILMLHAYTTASEFEASHIYFSYLTWRNMLTASVICAGSFAAGYARVMLEARAEAARALEQTIHAEARELEARFHPHFLFNALSSIAALIRTDRIAAAEMCRRLSGLVSKTVARAGVDSWPLNEELDLVWDYLYVQSTRFGDRLHIVGWDIHSAARQESIPRLVLQPLIENIFKHAVASSNGTTTAGLSIYRRGQRIEIELWNSTGHAPQPPDYGRGLTFVSHRVRAAGGEMTIDTDRGRFSVRCSIPVRKRSYRAPRPIRRAPSPSDHKTHARHAAPVDNVAG